MLCETCGMPPDIEKCECANHKRIAELEARDELLRQAVEWFEMHRPQWGPGTLPTWFVDARDQRS